MNLSFRRLSKTPTWAVTLGVGVAVVAYALFVFLPFQRSITQLRQKLHEKQLQIVQSDQLLLPLASQRERLLEIRRHTHAWQQHAPGPQELAAFFARLSEQAHHANVSLRRFEPQPARNLQCLQQHSVVLAVQGEFEQIFDFLTRIEQLPQTIWPSHLRLAQPAGGSASLQCEMTLTIFGDHAGSTD